LLAWIEEKRREDAEIEISPLSATKR